MHISNMMKAPVVTLRPDMSMRQAADAFYQTVMDGAPVVDQQGRIVGLITKSHFIEAIVGSSDALDRAVREFMITDVFTLSEDMTLPQLEQNAAAFKHSCFPVLNNKRQPVEIINRTDLIQYLSNRYVLLADEMQAVLNSVSNGVMVTDENGIITLFNPAAENITGIHAESVLGQHVSEAIPNSGLQRVLETGVAEINQQQTINNCKIVTNRSPIIKNNKISGTVAVFQDVTELQNVAAELETVKSLKSTLESAIESIFEGIVVVDKDGLITMMNQAYREFLGVEDREVIGQHVTNVVPNTHMHVVVQTGKAEVGELQRIGENQVIVSRIPIIKDGEVVGAVGKVLFKDLKDFKLLSRKLNTLRSELEYYKEELNRVHGGKYTLERIIGVSEKMQWLKSIAVRAAKGNSTVLILGESGTGKELFAHAIHNASLRSRGPLIRINCAALPENLLESELFGYDEGAFTGARKGGKPGKFELANGGTIFLDEIGDMAMSMQAKLLRVLQEREIERVGGTKTIRIDVRIIAATNCDLEEMIEQGTFRQDLYYRLNIITLLISPLRERKEDIPVLCTTLLNKINSQFDYGVEGVSAEAMALLMEYNWPGNVRELENVLERAVNLVDEENLIETKHLPPLLKKRYKPQVVDAKTQDRHLAGIMDEAEKAAIYKALEAAGGNKSKAAKLLGIHRSGFYQKLQKYNIN